MDAKICVCGYSGDKFHGKTCQRCHNKKHRAIQRSKPGYRELVRRYGLRTKFGISLETYEAMVTAQGGACAICGTTDPLSRSSGKTTGFVVDHDHATGKVRALLCSHCNTGIGFFADNPDVCRKAASYLEYHRGRS